MRNKDDIDMEMLDKLPIEKRIEIATKFEKIVENELGEYNISKNEAYQKVATEIGKEYGLTRNEAALLYLGWDAHKKLNNIK